MAVIWLINQYGETPATGLGGRHHYLAKEMAAHGHSVTLVAAGWHHLMRADAEPLSQPRSVDAGGYAYVRLPVPHYRDARDKKRVLNWFRFAAKLLSLDKLLTQKPDAIMYSSPSLVGFLAAERLARRLSSRLVFEVRDIWPLTLTQVGGFSTSHPFIRFLQVIEDRAYRKADAVISNIPGAVAHMQGRGMPASKFHWVANGFSLAETEAPEPLSPTLLAALPKRRFTIGYAGTLGAANALDVLLHAAALLRNEKNIQFVIVGKGRDGPALQEIAREQQLTNVVFLPEIRKPQIPTLLSHFDACYLGWRKTSLYDFGIAANKLFDYLYAAKPIVHAYSGGHDPVARYRAGLTVPAEDAAALAESIMRLRDMSEEARAELGHNGRQAALEHHEYAMLANKLEKVLLP